MRVCLERSRHLESIQFWKLAPEYGCHGSAFRVQFSEHKKLFGTLEIDYAELKPTICLNSDRNARLRCEIAVFHLEWKLVGER